MKKYIGIFLVMALAACKRDNGGTFSQSLFDEPVISKINRSLVQGGDTLTVFGSNFRQDGTLTELAIAGRTSAIIKLTNDSLQAIVPLNTHTGKLMLTISRGNQYKSIYGPEVSVIATPAVLDFTPWIGYEGDTISFIVKNFAPGLSDNFVWMDGKPAKIVSYNNKDTLKAIVPEGANTGNYAWRTYNGPKYESEKQFPVRKKHYEANNIMDWLRQDPAYSYLYAVLTSDQVKGYTMTYDTLAHFLYGDTLVAYFLPTNDGWMAEGITSAEELIKKQVSLGIYKYINSTLASMLPNNPSPDQLTPGKQATILSENIVFPFDSWRTHRKNLVNLTKEGDSWYIQAYTLWDTGLDTPQKIQRVHKVGNKYLYELKGLLPYDVDY